MQSIRPSRKRAGTSTNATPSDPARRIRLGSSSESDLDDKDAKITDWLHSHDSSQSIARTSPIPIPTYNDYQTKYITPPTPCSSPELQGPSNCRADIDRSRYPSNIQYSRPGYSTAYQHQRNEFPFPIQPLPKQLRNIRRLELTIPEEPEPGEFDVDIPSPTGHRTGRSGRPHGNPLPTPPRSHPSVPTCFSYSPPSSAYGQQPLTPTPTPSSTAPSSGLPSLSSDSSCSHSYSNTYSPISPNTPTTPSVPLTRFNSAAAALKLVLMANDVGMSLQELEELNEFAAAPMSGDSKRAGRVLVRRDIQQRREKGTGKSGKRGMWTGGQDIFHRREDCRSENCGRHVTAPVPGGMWRDVEWSRSRFSDSTCTTNEDMDVDMDGDEEMTALEGYIKMAVDADADADADGDARRSLSIVNMSVNKTVLGTAEVGRRVRPAELRVKSSVERVEATVGPLGERVWT